MPPRSGQLDQISEAIGELKGSVKTIERYIHEHRHEVSNASAKIDALGAKITGDIAAVEERMRVRFELVESRLLVVEKTQVREDGQRSVWVQLLQSPIVAGAIGGLLAMLAMAWAFLSGHVK